MEFVKCNLCNAVEFATANPQMNLLPDEDTLDFIIMPNKFPIIQGFSLAITKEERDMYTTKDLSRFVNEFSTIQRVCETTGLEVFRNCPGFGASIPQHEHWHLATFREGYNMLGTTYGLDAAEKVKVKGNSGVSVMPSFPFAHLIFDKDPSKILKFLENIQESLGSSYDNGAVPHIIAEGFDGYLVAPAKKYQTNYDIGCAEVAGHFISSTRQEFLNKDFNFYMNEMSKFLPTKGELKLEKFI